MQYLSSGPEDDLNQSLVRADNLFLPGTPRQPYPATDGAAEEANPLQIGRLLRKYWPLLLVFIILGAAGGFVSVILSSPMYKSHLILEVQNSNGLLRPGEGASAEGNEIDIQTQVQILRSGSFLKKGADRMNDSPPLAPMGRDIFSRLRQRIHPATQNPIEAAKTGLAVAMASFDARPVNHTRLIELTTQSTSPDVAAGFLNAMFEIFKEDSNTSRTTTASATSAWLAQQIDDAKARLNEAEEKLRDFSQQNNNLFAGDTTLDDAKLAQLKSELARIEPVLLNRRNRYEQTLKLPPEQLAEALDDGVLRGYQSGIENLKREKAALLTTFTEKHEKVQKIDAQLEALQKSYSAEISSVLMRIRHDYEATLKEEKSLAAAYAGESQRVGSEAGKTQQFHALQREADTQRQTYLNLLMQQNQSSVNTSVPQSPIRKVEEAVPADAPFKPQPVVNIMFGAVFGLALTGGLIFLRERMDRSIKVPGMTRRLFNAPELGVIPNLGNGHGAKRGWLGAKNGNGIHEDANTALVAPAGAPTFVTESFRSTLASILRNQASGRPQKIILVTSPGPSEGKTTVVQNLGIVLAESGRKVLLVDADFRRPHLHRKFGLANDWGLIDVLCEDLPLSEYPLDRLAVPTGLPGLAIVPNRVSQNNVAKALYSPRFRTVLDDLSRHYDMILVDAPPILSVADARIIAPLTDSLILVLRCGVTDRESAMEAYHRIQADGISMLGTVLTDYDLNSDKRRQYYYDYGDASRV